MHDPSFDVTSTEISSWSIDSSQILPLGSSRMAGLVPLLLKLNAAKCLIEDYGTLLESRFDACHVIENSKNDAGILILQVVQDTLFFCSLPFVPATYVLITSFFLYIC